MEPPALDYKMSPSYLFLLNPTSPLMPLTLLWLKNQTIVKNSALLTHLPAVGFNPKSIKQIKKFSQTQFYLPLSQNQMPRI